MHTSACIHVFIYINTYALACTYCIQTQTTTPYTYVYIHMVELCVRIYIYILYTSHVLYVCMQSLRAHV